MVSTRNTPKASTHIDEPITPSQTHEPCAPQLSFSLPNSVSSSVPVGRRSPRLLASKMDSADSSLKSKSDDGKAKRNIARQVGDPAADDEQGGSGNGIRVLELKETIDQVRVDLSSKMDGNGSDSGQCRSTSGIPGSKSYKAKGTTESTMNVDLNSSQHWGDERSKGFLNLRSGKRILKRGVDSDNTGESRGRINDDFGDAISLNEDGTGGATAKRARKTKTENKTKENLDKDDLLSTGHPVHLDGLKPVDIRQVVGGDRKGKRKLGDDGEKSNVIENVDEGPSSSDLLPNVVEKAELEDNAASQDPEPLRNANTGEHGSRRNEYMGRFREIARENASRFAYFTADEGHDCPSNEPEVDNEIEDWPGPFSTAMKIIKDRASKGMQTCGISSEKGLHASINWVPKMNQQHKGAKLSVPSLQELCLSILAENADAIVSLDNVPDALRHKLSQLFCDSRKMNNHIFELLVSGAPTEIRVRDCSWMAEEQFTKSFQMCNASSLVVLQLDQCGRCLPDHVLLATLAQAPKYLPRLTSLSLCGACRLSDGGLQSLVSSTPALQSINLSQCSLLTSSSLFILADSLGPLLKELYLDDCQSIDAALIVPALQKLEHLEVLSVAGIQTVCDDFIKDYIIARGHNMKELVLRDCVKLTDSSMKVIAEHCPGLKSLDLMNLSKLTDTSIVYLTNGCRALHMLKLCRNPFSDEAIAAFLETNGESLKELWLNNVKKVGHHTALSLANHAKNMHTLDLSWCRNLTDNAVGLIVDSCLSMRLLKVFGCTQITDVFLNGHSNPKIKIIGLKMSPVLQHVKVPDSQQCALHYSSVSS